MIHYEEQMFDQRSKMAMRKHAILCTLVKVGHIGTDWFKSVCGNRRRLGMASIKK